MKVIIYLLLVTACTLGDKNEKRRNKLPFVADAVGNTLPPPSNVPATVGSPVNLLTPDRYEFYTFDESGELVKRLMTLEEIQAIVAAGEEAEGLVTIANESQPTVSYNVKQPPYTKVHSVVTNVQNVLKAQMEAHKKNPQLHPTLDTPDVSDSWSLILPSIFGNSGVDILFDKSPSSVSTPETDTLENESEDENSLSKEATNDNILTSSTVAVEVTEKVPIKEIVPVVSSPSSSSTTTTSTTTTTTTTTTPKPTTTSKPTTTQKPTTTPKPVTTTKAKVKITTTSTLKPETVTSESTTPIALTTTTTETPVLSTEVTITTTSAITTRAPSTTSKPVSSTRRASTPSRVRQTTTAAPQTKPPPTRTRGTTTTTKPTTRVKSTTPKVTTFKPEVTTITKQNVTFENDDNQINVEIKPHSGTSATSTDKSTIEYEKISTFIPLSTANYVNDRSTHKPILSTKAPIVYRSTTPKSIPTTTSAKTISTTVLPLIQSSLTQVATTEKIISSTNSVITTTKSQENEKGNVTTITTQSVSPSTTVSSTEYLSPSKLGVQNDVDSEKYEEPLPPLFDVAQSISQIASDLGGNYQPLPTTSNLLEIPQATEIGAESKESVELDIPSASANDTNPKKQSNAHSNGDNFIQISTLNPNNKTTQEKPTLSSTTSSIIIDSVQKLDVSPVTPGTSTIDPILSESMGDLISQVVHQSAPPTQNINASASNEPTKTKTTESTDLNSATTPTIYEPTSKVSNKVRKHTSSTTQAPIKAEKPYVTKDNLQHKKVSNKVHANIEKTDKNSSSEQNLIQISTSDHNDTKTESPLKKDKIGVENTFKPITNIKNTEQTQNINNGISSTEKYIEKNTKAETIALTESSSPTPAVASKDSQSSLNKINSEDNKNSIGSKLEHLPKIDDVKKKIQKVNIAEEELINERNNSWKLVPTLSPPKVSDILKDKIKSENHYTSDSSEKDIILDFSNENQGLEVTTKDLDADVAHFTELSNELAFRYWNVIFDELDQKRSFVISPYSIFSMLGMIFMGARGATSEEMNEILKLDDMVTFNPHFTLKNISDSITDAIESTSDSGVAVSAFIRELYSDRNRGKILTFYKERAQHFYTGHVEEINFKLVSDIIRRRTNLLVKRYTFGKIPEYMKTNTVVMHPPLAALTANIFETDCSGTSVDGRDGEMYFVVSPNVRQRRLVPVPAVVYKSGFLAGYDPTLDATAAALGNTNSIVSTLFLMPGQQGNVVQADDLTKLETRLLEIVPTTPTWNRLLRTLLPRNGLELQIPRFSHKSTFNVSSTLKVMGLKDLFNEDHADLGGLNGPSKDLYLSDMLQLNTFATCGEGVIGEQHHIEEYPEIVSVGQRRRARWLNDWDEPRDYQRAFHDPHDVGDAMHLPLHLRPRQARLPSRSSQPARLKFDRPFLYFVRHNPSGMILYFGRYNPRLLP